MLLRQFFSVFGRTEVCKDCVKTLLLCLNYICFKGNIFVSVIPVSFYHFILSVQCMWADLTLICISSGSLWDVAALGRLPKQIYYIWYWYKTKTYICTTDLEVILCHCKVLSRTECGMHEIKGLPHNRIMTWAKKLMELKKQNINNLSVSKAKISISPISQVPSILS